jgi:hypothetical protein
MLMRGSLPSIHSTNPGPGGGAMLMHGSLPSIHSTNPGPGGGAMLMRWSLPSIHSTNPGKPPLIWHGPRHPAPGSKPIW